MTYDIPRNRDNTKDNITTCDIMENIYMDYNDKDYLYEYFPKFKDLNFKTKTMKKYEYIVNNLNTIPDNCIGYIEGSGFDYNFTEEDVFSKMTRIEVYPQYRYFLYKYTKFLETTTMIPFLDLNLLVTAIYFLKDEYAEIHYSVSKENIIYKTINNDDGYRSEKWNLENDSLARENALENILNKSKNEEDKEYNLDPKQNWENLIHLINNPSSYHHNFGDKEICINGKKYIRHVPIKPYMFPHMYKDLELHSYGKIDYYIEFIYESDLTMSYQGARYAKDYFWNKHHLWCCCKDSPYFKLFELRTCSKMLPLDNLFFVGLPCWQLASEHIEKSFENILPVNSSLYHI